MKKRWHKYWPAIFCSLIMLFVTATTAYSAPTPYDPAPAVTISNVTVVNNYPNTITIEFDSSSSWTILSHSIWVYTGGYWDPLASISRDDFLCEDLGGGHYRMVGDGTGFGSLWGMPVQDFNTVPVTIEQGFWISSDVGHCDAVDCNYYKVLANGAVSLHSGMEGTEINPTSPTTPSWALTGPPNTNPSVTVDAPNGGEIWTGTQSILWSAADAEQTDLTANLYHGASAAGPWTLINTVVFSGGMPTGDSWDTTTVADGTYWVRVEVLDGVGGVGEDVSDASFDVNNTPVACPIYVPDDYATIQQAIDVASNGCEIIVRDGTYNEQINFLGKLINLHSENGAATTTIDGSIGGAGGGAVVSFVTGETNSSILDGFNITNGDDRGITCNNSSSPMIVNCIISSNYSPNAGGGINCSGGSNPIIQNSAIRNNSAGASGGGIATDAIGSTCSPKVINCIIKNNKAGLGNPAYGGGGIAFWSDWSPEATPPEIINCIIVSNTAGASGDNAGISLQRASSPRIINSTIANNIGGNCGGIGGYNQTQPVEITNCIVWGNTNNQIYFYAAAPNITYSDIEGGWAGAGNISADPLLNTAYHLIATSPCVDAGDPASVLPTDDIDGDARPQGATYDMGADEYVPGSIPVVTPVPDNPSPQLGDTVTVEVNVADVTDLYAVNFDMLFNPTVVDYVGAVEGAFLDNGNPIDAELLAEPLNGDPSSGVIVAGVSRIGAIGGVSGSGNVATLSFMVVGAYCTTTDLIFDNALLEGELQGSTITAVWDGTTLTVTLSAPTNVTATDAGTRDQINVCWDAVAGAAGYEVYRSNTPGGVYELIGTTAATCYNDASCILPAQNYYYQVKATSGASCYSELSAEVSGVAAGLLGDINNDGRIDGRDLSRLARGFGASLGQPRYDCQSDLDRSELIDGADLIQLTSNFGLTQ